MKQIDRRIVIIAAFIFIVGMAFGLMKFLIAQKEKPLKQMAEIAKRVVKAEEVKYKTIIAPVFATGRLTSVSEIDIIAEASGKILKSNITLKKGAEFSKGDVLFTIYTNEAILALKAKKSQFLNSLANLLPDIKIDYPEYDTQFREFFTSIDVNKTLPKLPDFKSEKLEIFLASRNVLSDYYGILKDELQLSRHTIVAPFNGTYSDVYLEAGAYTNTGGRVARAIQTDFFELEAPLEKLDAQWVNVGDNVKIYSELSSAKWQGKVVRKSKFVDPNTQSQQLYIRLSNSKENPLLVGEYLKATFPGRSVNNVMEAPRNAVFNSNEVFVINNSQLQKKIINIIKVNEKTLIFNGLKEGEMLVMQPLINVLEGTLVEILGQQKESKPTKKKSKSKKD
ncbi:MAG: HlyD family efflux transporter periplasmic adaptor subunit [Bacteroidales bacterium]|jgi:membrane fusion protein (multidrug efflux system)|nr:HlyD family efflux transporter periplasmic adaptor subunit [Bacteroidales bacterium]